MGHRDNFTVGRIANFRCEDGKRQTIFMDAKTPGLGVRITEKKSKSFIFETRLHGKTLRITIGDVRAWSLGQAQAEARRLKALTDQGVDPRQQAAERRAAHEAAQANLKRQAITFGDAWAIYLETRTPKWSASHIRAHQVLAALGGEPKKRGIGTRSAGPIASLLSTPLTNLSADLLASWLEREANTRPTAASLSFRLIRAFIRWAEDEPTYKGLVPIGIVNARKVRDALPKNRTREGDCLQREQLPAWFDAVRKIGNPVIAAYLQGLLLTGARREEMAGLRWADIDFQWRTLFIRDKIEGSRTIPLPPYLGSLIAALPRRNEWVFSSLLAKEGRITEPRYAHDQALQEAGLPHITLHGLRRSFSTLAEWCDMPTGVVAQVMGHRPSALAEKHYRRRSIDLLRKWHDILEQWILEQANVEFLPLENNKPKLISGPP